MEILLLTGVTESELSEWMSTRASMGRLSTPLLRPTGGRADLLLGGCADAPEADQDPERGGQREPQAEGQFVVGVLTPGSPQGLPGPL